jgi:hypothetical protein
MTIDESRNVTDTSQLLLSVRGVNSDFEISEELACVHMSGATKGGVGVENILQNLVSYIFRAIDILFCM